MLKNQQGAEATAEKDFTQINNRKYLGSKYRLLPFLKEIILKNAGSIGIFIDGFAGTGVVGHFFAPYVKKIISNDLLFSNFVVLNAFLCSNKNNCSLEKIKTMLEMLNRSEPVCGYVHTHFSGTYFTPQNSGLIDSIRENIQLLFENGQCTLQEKYILLTSLLFAADKAANTVGQYDAFLKNISGQSYTASGRHLSDSNVHKRIVLKMPAINFYENNEVYCCDFNNLNKNINGDVLYIDPPYNHRQYIDCYHVLENIMLWNKPVLSGKTKKFERTGLKSKYSMKKKSIEVFDEMVRDASVNHIFLSYNNEGIIPDQVLVDILGKKGRLTQYEKSYSIFGNGAGKSVKRKITERIFYCKVDQ